VLSAPPGSPCCRELDTVATRIVDRLGIPASVYTGSYLKSAFDYQNAFQDSNIDASTTRRGSANVLTEVQNLLPLRVPAMKKFDQPRVPRTPSTLTPEWDAYSDHSDTSISSMVNTVFDNASTDILEPTHERERSSGEHSLEVVLCAIKALDQHIRLGPAVVRVLSRLALDLAWGSAADRPDLLTAPVWIAGRVEQSATQNVSKLFHDVPGREEQVRMLSAQGLRKTEPPIAEVCGDVQWLLVDSRGSSEGRAGKALETLSVIRQMHTDLIEYTQNAPAQETTGCNTISTMTLPQNRFGAGPDRGVGRSFVHMPCSGFPRSASVDGPCMMSI